MSKKNIFILSCVLACSFLFASDIIKGPTDQISVPQLINYQGKLTNTSGNPVSDSIYSITFRFFSAASGGTALWTETQSVQTRNGLYNCLLGSTTPITSIPIDGNLYLEMQVNPNSAMTPRMRIVSSAYAFLAKKADTAYYATSAPLTRPITPPIATTEITDGAVTNIKLGADAITTDKILNGTIIRADVVTNFKAPYSDTADYVRNINVPYVDSARVAVNAYNANQLQGKDTTALSTKFVDEGQANAISTAMIIDSAVTTAKIKTGAVTNIKLGADAVTTDKILNGTILRADVATGFIAPYSDTADYVRNINVPYVDSSRIAVNAYNANELQGKDTIALSAKFVDEGQTNSVTSGMITDNTIVRNDVATNFKAPYADSADYVKNISVPYVDSARVAVNAYNAKQLQGKDTTALSAKFVDEGQANAISTAMIIDSAVTTAKIKTGAVTNIKLGADAVTTDKILNGTILRADVATGFIAPYSDTADYVRNINVPYVDSARVAVNAYNANQLQGKDTTALSAKFVDEGQVNSITSAMITDNTIVRSDVATNFTAPYSDTAEYARSTPPVGVIDSARIAINAYNAYKLQGKDTTALDNRYVNETQANSITSSMITDNTIVRNDVATNFKSPDADSADYVRNINVPYVDSARVAVNAYNAKQLQGKDTIALSAKFVDEGQANSITSGMITDNTIVRNDVATNFKAPYSDTSDYVRNINLPYVDSARVAVNAYNANQLQGKDTIALSAKFIDEGQTAGGDLTGTYPNPTITNNAVNTVKIADTNVTMAKIQRAGAATGQVLKWTGSAWAPSADVGSSGEFLPLAGGIMTGAITNIGNPAITMGKGNFGTGNSNTGTDAFVAGKNNNARGSYSVVSGGGGFNPVDSNSAKGAYSVISGGTRNAASGYSATVGGGTYVRARGDYSVVSGGGGPGEYDSCSAIGQNSTVGGGRSNISNNFCATVGGGCWNAATGDYATVAGGKFNYARGLSSVIAGGGGVASLADSNSATGDYSMILGGQRNIASGSLSFASGRRAKANHAGAFVWADNTDADFTSTGTNQFLIRANGNVGINTNSPGSPLTVNGIIQSTTGGIKFPDNSVQTTAGVSGSYLPIAGGTMTGAITSTGDPAITMGKGNFGTGNINPGTQAFVAGRNNNARGNYSVVSGGGGANVADSNSAIGNYSVIGGGTHNTASGYEATVGGGINNTASGDGVVIGGGFINTASQQYATVGGGQQNTASGAQATIGGGGSNTASSSHATVGGGYADTASGQYATIGGGYNNTASYFYATVGGGRNNAASNYSATVGGGFLNSARGQYSVVSGGGGSTAADSNSAMGDWSAIAGGRGNIASGDYSFAAGRKAKANHAGAFVWADGTDADFTSTGTNQFLIRANGNVGINTNSPSSPLTVAGMIQSTTDGYKFPDNSVQTTAATGGGTVTSVGTGDGLTGGPITTSGTISIADNGVTTAKIIDSAVTSAKILNGTITGNDIAIPLSLTGSASFPNAILKVRNNNTGPGISVDSAGFGGLSVNYSFTDGVIIKRADGTAFWVDTAGGQAMRIIYAASDGIGIDDVGWNGLWAMHVGDNGVSIDSAETNGILAHGNFAGGDFYAGNAGAVGLSAHSYNNSSSDTAIQVFGKGFATGGWSTGGLLDNKSAPCLISPELGIVTAGSGTLSNGKADINFEPLFAENTRTDIPIRITVTPKGKPAGLVYVTESKSTGFKVEIEPIPGLEKNSTDITFDWIAFGTLKDYQTTPAAQAQWQQMVQERLHQDDVRRAQKQERNELLNKAKELR